MTQAAAEKKAPAKGNGSSDMQKSEGTVSERFTNAVMKEFGSLAGGVALSPYQKKLAQHLFIKIDTSINELERKRQDKNPNNPPIVWANVNMSKLAVDAMHRIELGLDALIPNHISPIPYLNGRTKKYDLDLRVGYVGKDMYRREMAKEKPVDIRYELVYETDQFEPIKKSSGQEVETYKFQVKNAFKRGPVVGGFGYIIYEDAKKNELVLVTDEDFKKAESKAGSKEFWGGYPDAMKYKTIVIRTTNKLQMDPAKVNASFAAVEKDDAGDALEVEAIITEQANKGETLELPASDVGEPGHPEPAAEEMVKCPEGGTMVAKSYCNGECNSREGCPEFGDPSLLSDQEKGEAKKGTAKRGPRF